MSLLDKIKSRLTAAPEPVESGTDIQQGMQQVLQTKATGKASPTGTAPKASAIGATAAESQANFGLQQTAAAGQTQAAQLGLQEEAVAQQAELGNAQLSSQRRMAQEKLSTQRQLTYEQLDQQANEADARMSTQLRTQSAQQASAYANTLANLASQSNTTIDNLFAGYERSNRELADRKDALDLELLTSSMALADEAYMREISQIYTERGLNTAINFKRDMTDMALGANLSKVMSDLGFKRAYDASDRSFKSDMSRMSADDALKMARAQNQDKMVSAVIGGGVSAYTAKYPK